MAALHRVPFSIDEHVGQTELFGHIHVLLDDIVVVGTMIIGPINPRHRTRLNPTGIRNLARFAHIGHQRGFRHIFQASDDSQSPSPHQTSPRRGGFLFSPPYGGGAGGEALPITHKTGSTLSAPDIRLREQYESAAHGFEQGRESPAVVVALCRLRNAAKRRNGLHLVGRREREESLVGIRPLLHPPAGALGNPVGQ